MSLGFQRTPRLLDALWILVISCVSSLLFFLFVRWVLSDISVQVHWSSCCPHRGWSVLAFLSLFFLFERNWLGSICLACLVCLVLGSQSRQDSATEALPALFTHIWGASFKFVRACMGWNRSVSVSVQVGTSLCPARIVWDPLMQRHCFPSWQSVSQRCQDTQSLKPRATRYYCQRTTCGFWSLCWLICLVGTIYSNVQNSGSRLWDILRKRWPF